MRLIVSILLPLLCLAAAHTPDDTPKETVAEQQFAKRAARLWSLQPVPEPPVPVGGHGVVQSRRCFHCSRI